MNMSDKRRIPPGREHIIQELINQLEMWQYPQSDRVGVGVFVCA